MQLQQQIGVSVCRGHQVADLFTPKGVFGVELWRDSKLFDRFEVPNGVKTEGKNKILDVMFHEVTQLATWYIGLMDASGFSAEAAADTLSTHAGWNEFTAYTGDRKEWVEGAASGGAIANSTPATFNINASGSVQGIFVCSAESGTSGILWSSGQFAAAVTVGNGDELKITYTVSC
jgi:hypothetical protein